VRSRSAEDVGGASLGLALVPEGATTSNGAGGKLLLPVLEALSDIVVPPKSNELADANALGPAVPANQFTDALCPFFGNSGKDWDWLSEADKVWCG